MAVETLQYTGDFDPSAILEGMQKVDKGFQQTETVATKTFNEIAGAADTANERMTQGEIRRIENAQIRAKEDLETRRQMSAEQIKIEEQETARIAQVQAKAEQEYLRALSQAEQAEAAAYSQGFQRRVEKENAFHTTRLQSLVGNDEAIEAETRRHDAVLVRLQTDAGTKMDHSMRLMSARFGSMGNQLNGLQMSFFGVSAAMEGTEGRFGQMIGRVGLMTSGLMGMAQAIEQNKAQIAGMGVGFIAGGVAIVAVAVALGLLLERQKELQALAAKNDWIGDPEKYKAVVDAMNSVDTAQKALGKSAQENVQIYGAYAGIVQTTSIAMKSLDESTTKLEQITGLTSAQLKALYGDISELRKAYMEMADQRILDANFEFQRAVVAGEKESLQKQEDLQRISNEQALMRIRNHYNSVKTSAKATFAERVAASAQEGRELAIQEQINQMLLDNVRTKAGTKIDKKENTQFEEYHRMRLESEKTLNKGLAALDENQYAKSLSLIEAEKNAVSTAYIEKFRLAKTNVKAIAELGLWLSNEGSRIDAMTEVANEQHLKTQYDAYQKYLGDMAALDIQIKNNKLAVDGTIYEREMSALDDWYNAQMLVLQTSREAWEQAGLDRIQTAQMVADELEKIDAIHAQRSLKIIKEGATEERKVELLRSQYSLEAAQNFAEAIGIMSDHAKGFFVIQQGLSLAMVAIKTAEAVVSDNANILTAWKVPYDIALGASQAALIAATTIKGFEKGTDDFGGGLARINEKGGEIVDLPSGTRIIPHDVSMQMAKTMNQTSSIHIGKIEINGSGLNQAQLTGALSDAMSDAMAGKMTQEQNRGADFFNDGTFDK